jgi:hypothetical protein
LLKEQMDDHLQLLEVNRFRQVSVKTRFLVPVDSLVHPEPGQRYRRNLGVLTYLLNRIHSGPVRQSDTTQNEVELWFIRNLRGIRRRGARFNGITFGP